MAQQGVKFARVHGRIVPIKQRPGGAAPAKKAPTKPVQKEPLRLGRRIGGFALGAMAIGLGVHFGSGMIKSVIRAGGGAAMAGVNKGIARFSKTPALASASARAVAPNLRTAKRGLLGMAHPMNLYGGLVGGLLGSVGATLVGGAFRKRKTIKQPAKTSA